ncbi:MAG TPA: alanine--tRNA ligase [Chloroflexota bacterium]
MSPPSSDEIRAAFIEFWETRGSHLQPSSSLIPHNDPTVLLTTAGMQQFVPYFLGKERSPYPRYVSVQKCFRTSDIDEVGDRSHLTFFEMLGNFSVGDYFKKEVIPWALEFATTAMGLVQDRIWITIHDTDDAANAIWLEAGIPQDRIKRFGDKENWWGPPGKSGPCGPNSELYYAQPGFACGFPGDPEGCDCGRLEFWNLVFMQYNQDEDGLRTLLPQPNVDTGMGMERATVVTQGLESIYDTDLFRPIIHAAEAVAGVTYGTNHNIDYALRVLADHARAMTFLVLDGVVPGQGDRDYVLRRIVRRAIRYGRRLGVERQFLGDMVDAVVLRMREHYPDLARESDRIKQVVAAEEELFSRTLQAGSAQVERLIAEAGSAKTISGGDVFDLYQTYGFPPELTEEILREAGLTFDRAEFEAALEAERQRARQAAVVRTHQTGEWEFTDLPATEFLAWTATQSDTRILALQRDDDTARLVLEASPFYPEGGGQVGDTGVIRTPGGLFVVDDTHIDGAGRIVHFGRVEGEVRPGELARAEVDIGRRDRSRRHHTATHLLHRALKDVLGEGTSQQGSYVGPDQLRFDFNYPRGLDAAQLQAVTDIINDRSMDDLPVHWEIVPMDQARQMGAVMMFGEKYGDSVRVVSIGEYSRELCGGTHTHHSGELGAVAIAAESGIGTGKRRILAYAGPAALAYLQQRLRLLETVSQRVGARNPEELEARVDAMLAEMEALRRELLRRQQQQAHNAAGALVSGARVVKGVSVVAAAVDGASRDDLAKLADAVRDQLRSGVVILAGGQDGRIPLVAEVTRDLTDRLHAGTLVKEVGARAGGGGGGNRPDFATGQGTDPAKLAAALQHALTLVEQALPSPT